MSSLCSDELSPRPSLPLEDRPHLNDILHPSPSSSPSLGPFLTSLLTSVQNFEQNKLAFNLRVTAIISKVQTSKENGNIEFKVLFSICFLSHADNGLNKKLIIVNNMNDFSITFCQNDSHILPSQKSWSKYREEYMFLGR